MTAPTLPAMGTPNWYPYMQALDAFFATLDPSSNRIAYGSGALTSLPPDYNVSKSIVALGRNAMASTTASRYAIAIGPYAMQNSVINRDDIAIGESALREIQATTADYDQASLEGTRMVAIGGNAGLYARSNYNEVLIGRNTSSCKTGGFGLVAVGPNAIGGHAQYGFATPTDGGEIINNMPWGGTAYARTVAVGSQSLNKAAVYNCVAVGGDSLANNKRSDDNTAVGASALFGLDTGTGIKGGVYTDLNTVGTYSQTTTVVTLSHTSHGLAVGDWAYIRLTSGASQTFASDQVIVQVATVPNANTFTVVSPVSRSATGASLLAGRETSAAAALNTANSAFGKSAGEALVTSSHNTLVGASAAVQMTDGGWNTVVGSNAITAATTGTNNTIMGYSAYSSATGGGGNVAIGSSAMRFDMAGASNAASIGNGTAVGRSSVVVGDNGVAVGYLAKSADNGVAIGNGASTGAFTNSVAIGNGAANNAANRITLGNASITQIRAQVTAITALSDERDKTDIEDTPLGLEFISRLRPVDYRNSPRSTGETDPTLRHGFLAQQVLSVTDDLGVDFGGVDDSDPDNLAMTYVDMIAPLVRAVQELSARVVELEER